MKRRRNSAICRLKPLVLSNTANQANGSVTQNIGIKSVLKLNENGSFLMSMVDLLVVKVLRNVHQRLRVMRNEKECELKLWW